MAGVLVVTPNPIVGEALVQALRAKGLEVSHAESGELALRVASARPPAAILMDPSLPSMDRWHTVKQLYADPHTARVPILTITADIETAAGLSRVLQKVERAMAPSAPGPPSPSPGPSSARASARSTEGPPLARAPHPEDPLPPAREERAPEPAHRVLVVDDNVMNRDTLTRRLERRGYDVASVGSGEEALDAIDRRRFDLVLLDWMMPGLTGLEVLRRIRERWSAIELPVIMSTARSEADDIVEALKAEANDYVTKPLHFDVVLARMRTHLALSEAHRDLQANEHRYRALLENTGDMVVQFEVPEPVTYVSPASRTLLGYEPEQLTQRPFLDWLHPADRRALEQQFGRPGVWPPAFTFLARMERLDHQWIWVETSGRVLRDGDRIVVHAACRDVTGLVDRVLGDEPPLPLGGDLMAHRGWRVGGRAADDAQIPTAPGAIAVPSWSRPSADDPPPDVQGTEPWRNGVDHRRPVVLTLLVGDVASESHEELVGRVAAELRRALGAKRP